MKNVRLATTLTPQSAPPTNSEVGTVMTKQLVQNVDRMNVARTLSRLNMVPNRATRTLPRSVVTV